MNTKYRPLVIFDIDGTIINTVRSKRAKHPFENAIKKACGIDTKIDLKYHGGMCDIKIIRDLLRSAGLKENEIEERIDACKKAVVEEYKAEFRAGHIKVLPGVKEILDELKMRDAFIALGTGNIEERALFRMENLGLNYFEFGGFGGECIERECLIETAVMKAHERGFAGNGVFVIGDTEKDVIAAKNTGAKIIAVGTGRLSAEELKKLGADYALNDLSNTKEVIRIIYPE